MAQPASIDRSILVFAIWAVLGFLGLGFVLEGFARDSIAAAAIGIGLVIAAFVAHIIVNGIWQQGFSDGEATLGIGAYGVLALVFILSWATGHVTASGYLAGIALFGLIAVGFIAYLATRHGVRGAFSQFHIHKPQSQISGSQTAKSQTNKSPISQARGTAR